MRHLSSALASAGLVPTLKALHVHTKDFNDSKLKEIFSNSSFDINVRCDKFKPKVFA